MKVEYSRSSSSVDGSRRPDVLISKNYYIKTKALNRDLSYRNVVFFKEVRERRSLSFSLDIKKGILFHIVIAPTDTAWLKQN